MQIEVVIDEWAQQCCGVPFRVGGEASWQLIAAQPQAGSVPRFFDDQHDQAAEDVPRLAVTGTVASITGVSYPAIPTPGEARSYTADRSAPTLHPLDSVQEPALVEVSEYRVLLDVADGSALPVYRQSAAEIEERECEARTAERRRERMTDQVGVLLESLADEAQRSYAEVAEIRRATDLSAMTVQPLRVDAAAVYWARQSSEAGDVISVQVGDGVWRLPASVDNVAVVRELLDAAVHGRVEEHVRPLESPHRLDTEAHAADDRSWTATVEFEPFAADGFFAMPGQLWERLQRGEHRYQPWAHTDPGAGPSV